MIIAHYQVRISKVVPFDCPDDTIGRLAWHKRAMGMNLDCLGEVMVRDQEQLSDWLTGRHHPFKKNQDKIERFVDDQGVGKDPPENLRNISSTYHCCRLRNS